MWLTLLNTHQSKPSPKPISALGIRVSRKIQSLSEWLEALIVQISTHGSAQKILPGAGKVTGFPPSILSWKILSTPSPFRVKKPDEEDLKVESFTEEKCGGREEARFVEWRTKGISLRWVGNEALWLKSWNLWLLSHSHQGTYQEFNPATQHSIGSETCQENPKSTEPGVPDQSLNTTR